MALLSALKNISAVRSFEDAFRVRDITSQRMLDAVALWFQLYFDEHVDKCADTAQRIPYIVVDGLYKAAFGEYEYAAAENAKHVTDLLDNLDRQRGRIFQQTLIGGEGFIKPIVKRDGFVFSFINRASFVVLERDEEGNITSAGTMQRTAKNVADNRAEYYSLLERRTVRADGYLTIESKLFRSADAVSIGNHVPLDALPEYAALEPLITYKTPLFNLGLIQVKTPMENCVDGSPDGVSVYAAAAKKILAQYGLERRTETEYELTEPHVIASIDLQRRDSSGRLIEIPKYITPIVDDDPSEAGLTIYNPKPNQEQLEARANQNMRDIENIIGLRRGILSHVETDDRTATAVITSSGRYALTIRDFQAMWENAVRETIRTCNILGGLYHIRGWGSASPPEITISWGNGVLYDEAAEFSRLNLLVSSGNLRPEFLLGWQFDMPTETPQDLAAIRDKYIPDGDGEGDEV